MAELHPDTAREAARAALRYMQAFNGKGINWQSDEPWPHRIELAQALDWITDLSAMVLNLTSRIERLAQPLEEVRYVLTSDGRSFRAGYRREIDGVVYVDLIPADSPLGDLRDRQLDPDGMPPAPGHDIPV